MRNLCLDAALDELASAGIRDPVIARGAKHPQLRWTTPRGELRVFAVPGTPSDRRSAENVRHDLRKILRGDGMLATPQPRSAPVKQPNRIELIRAAVGGGRAAAGNPERLVGQVGEVGNPTLCL